MQILTNTGNTAIATAAATIVSAGDVQNNQLAVGFVPNCTGVTTTASVTLTIIRNDTAAVIGSATATNPGAGTSAIGPVTVVAPIPAGIAGSISLQVAGSAAAGNAAGSATAPCVLAVLP